MRSTTHQHGFTLIEMVMVIIVLGIVGAMVASFMKAPIDAYFATAHRAALSDEADTAVRRVARDIRKALPNSIRTPSSSCVEFIPTKTGGRYRAELNSSGGGDILDFTTSDTSFAMFGANSSLTDQAIVAGDVVAVYNLGITGADAYAGDNTSVVSAVVSGAETSIAIAGKKFPFASGSNRFHVIPGDERVVAYVCTGTQLIRRVVSTTFSSACSASGGESVLANNVSACSFTYNGSDLQRNALLQIGLTFTVSGESVNLYHEVHVNNTP